MKIRFLFFLPILFFHSPIFSQVSISGKVLNAIDQEPLIGAVVTIDNQRALTDNKGFYTLNLKNIGEYTIEVRYIGFETLNRKENFTENKYENFDFTLEEEVNLLNTASVTAGKFEKPLGEVTVSLDILKPKLIDNVNTRKLDDVLQKIPGVNVIDGQPNIRGGAGWSYGAGSRVLILMDDIPALQSDAGFANWRDFPIENIEQVEVVKGAASALYGSSAMNGIINIRTGFAKSTPETKVSMQYTSYLSPKDIKRKWWDKSPYDGTFSVGHKQKFGKLDIATSFLYFNQSSFQKDWYEKFGRFNLNSRYRITDKLTLGINANFNKGVGKNSFYWIDGRDSAYIGANGTYSTSDKTRFTIDPYLTYFDNFGNRHKILTRYYFIKNNLDNNQSNSSNLLYGEYQFQRSLKNITITAGTVATTTNTNAQLYGDTIFKSLNLAAYAQADAKFGKLNLSLGMRYEQNTIFGPKAVPFRFSPNPSLDTIFYSQNNGEYKESKPVFRIGANYQAAKATFIRASWGQGYRFPTVAEAFITTRAGGLSIKPNPTLTSETGWTTELGIKQGFKIGGFNGFVDASGFWSQYSDMMEFQVNRNLTKFARSFADFINFQSINVGNTVIKGFEVSVAGEGRIGNLTPSVLIGYTFIDPQYRDYNVATDTLLFSSKSSSANYNVLKYRYRHNFKFDAEVGYKVFSVGLSVQYNSFMEAVDDILAPAESNPLAGLLSPFLDFTRFRKANPGGFTVVDIRAAYRPIEKIKISLILANAFNEEYTYRPALLEAPRNMAVRLDWRF